jgi:hypothetical protein
VRPPIISITYRLPRTIIPTKRSAVIPTKRLLLFVGFRGEVARSGHLPWPGNGTTKADLRVAGVEIFLSFFYEIWAEGMRTTFHFKAQLPGAHRVRLQLRCYPCGHGEVRDVKQSAERRTAAVSASEEAEHE